MRNGAVRLPRRSFAAAGRLSPGPHVQSPRGEESLHHPRRERLTRRALPLPWRSFAAVGRLSPGPHVQSPRGEESRHHPRLSTEEWGRTFAQAQFSRSELFEHWTNVRPHLEGLTACDDGAPLPFPRTPPPLLRTRGHPGRLARRRPCGGPCGAGGPGERGAACG